MEVRNCDSKILYVMFEMFENVPQNQNKEAAVDSNGSHYS